MSCQSLDNLVTGVTTERNHQTFNEPCDIFAKINSAELHKWLRERKKTMNMQMDGLNIFY